MRLKPPTGYTKGEYRAQQEAKYNELQEALKGEPHVSKTIIDVQDLSQKYLEDEILMFEIYLFNAEEEMSDESETVRGIVGYLESLYDDFEIHDYSEIHKDIEKYDNDTNIDHDSAYFKLLEKKFAEARIFSLNAMLDMCHGKSFKYNVSKHDLSANIKDFKLGDTMQKLLLLSGHKKPETLYVQKAIYQLAETIKIEFKNKGKKLSKKTLVGEIFNKINSDKYNDQTVIDANLTEYNIGRKYSKNWRDVWFNKKSLKDLKSP